MIYCQLFIVLQRIFASYFFLRLSRNFQLFAISFRNVEYLNLNWNERCAGKENEAKEKPKISMRPNPSENVVHKHTAADGVSLEHKKWKHFDNENENLLP